MVPVRGIHPPPHVVAIGKRKERKTRIPSPSPESPRDPNEIASKPGTNERSRSEFQ